MNLRLRREPTLLSRVTFGDLYIENSVHLAEQRGYETWLCHTLEDAVREVKGEPVSKWKIKHETAIPFGTYALELVDSPKFGPDTLSLKAVPGFDYVRIHKGTTEKDTDGCILVGAQRHGASISHCQEALDRVKGVVVPELKAGREVLLTIEPHTQELDV